MSFEHAPKPANGNKLKNPLGFTKHKAHTCIFKYVYFNNFGSLGHGEILL